jgi:hypothetical protein
MFRLWFPVGLVALLLGAFALSAQVRDDPRQPPPATPGAGQKAVSPDRDLKGGRGPADKQAPHLRGQKRVYLGVMTMPVEDMSNRTRRKMNLKDTDGVIICEVMPDSPADEAGLRQGDVITHVNGKVVDDEEELSKDLHELGAGKPVKLSVIRDGEKQSITAKLEEVPAGPGGGMDEETRSMLHENVLRIERLERKIARLERRLQEMDTQRAGKNPQ